jgi:hypothetical protein
MLKSIPWYKRFVGEILSDFSYQALNDSERGQLSHLEMVCWRLGWIPADLEKLSRPPYCTGPVSPRVIANFSKAKGGKKLIHKGLEKQRAEYSEKCRKNAENGKNGRRGKKTQEVSENRSISEREAVGSSWDSQKKPEGNRKEEKRKEERSLAHEVISRPSAVEKAGASPTRSQIRKALGKTLRHLDSSPNGDQRKHLEEGIYRKKIGAAYFDATREGMKPDECIRQSVLAGALTLMGNRSVELKGLADKELVAQVWERIRPGISTLHEVQDFETRRKHVVSVVTRCLTDVAFEFWKRQADVKTAR